MSKRLQEVLDTLPASCGSRFDEEELDTPEGVRRILDLSWQVRTSDPTQAEELGHAALTILRMSSGIDAKDGEDLRALAWTYIANSRRIRGDLPAAKDMLKRAESHLQAGSHSPVFRAELLLIEAQVAREQRRFSESEDKLNQVIAIHRWSGDDQKVGLALLTKVNLLYTSGRSEECIAYLDQAEKLLNFTDDPRSQLSVVQARALCMFDLDRIQETEELLPEVRRLADHVGTTLDRIRVLWFEGMVLAAKGQSSEAEACLRAAREQFMREEIGIDAALVSLDLAAFFLESGRVNETREIAEEMLPLFESLDIRREAFGALILFHRAALEEQATAGMARDIAAFLKRTGTTPALKYEEPS